jgi:hypothetical protein
MGGVMIILSPYRRSIRVLKKSEENGAGRIPKESIRHFKKRILLYTV